MKLYETNTKITIDEYKKYNKTLFKKVNFIRGLLALIVSILLVVFIILPKANLSTIETISLFLAYFIGFLLAVLFLKLFQKISVKSTYKKINKNDPDLLDMKLIFYKDYMIQKTKKHEYKVYYKDLYEVLETKDNFYLMLSQNQGVIIIKANCNKRLIEFIEGLKK